MRFPVAKYNYLVKRFVLCTLTLEEAKKAAKNVIKEKRERMDEFNPLSGKFRWSCACIATGFDWERSNEGFEYWEKVSYRL